MASLCYLTIFALLATSTLGTNMEVKVKSSLSFDSTEAAKGRPVTKVVNLLKDMLKQMEKEAEEDQEIYDKMACWCETNDKEKTKSIADGEARVENLTAKIEELTALSGQLNTEIKNLEKEVAKNQEALEKATEMRMKQLGEFQDEEKDMLGAISSLKSAVTVLEKQHAGASSLLQVQTSQMHVVATKIQGVMQKHAGMLKHVLTHSERKVVTAFIQDSEGESYAPASGEIFGILNQMKETFESNLSVSQKEEMANEKGYQDLKAAKEEEITTGQDMINEKTQELATTDEKNAEAKEDLEDTSNTLAADQEFLATVKEQCAAFDAEMEERTKTRRMEMEACSKVVALLNSDEAHDLFGKTVGLLQTRTTSQSKRRAAASKLLSNEAKKLHNPRMSQLAYRVKLDSFTKVKKAIDDMIADLLETQKAEVKHKDFCVEEFNTNQLQTEQKEVNKADQEAKVEDLTMTIKALTDAINTLKADIAEAQKQMKRGSEDREIQNKEFQSAVADQRATQKLLEKALSVLAGFYGKKALMQLGQTPPVSFKPYKKAAGGGVMGMINNIVDEAKAMEAELIKAEEDSQSGYEAFVKETNASIEAKTADLINKSEEKSKSEASKVETEKDLASTTLELEQLSTYKSELHSSCDFLMKNFEVRQTARVSEVEALKQAKAILSGAKL